MANEFIARKGIIALANSSISGNLTATSFIKSDGTSLQFLKADGSIDSSTYQTALTNPVTGTGTSGIIAKFNGASTITNSIIYDNGTNVGIGTITPSFKLQVNGSFAATTKSFVIDHPTKPDHYLRYGSLEGPENGVYVRGEIEDSNIIELPEYWVGLIDPSTITVNLTPIGNFQKLRVKKIENNKIYIKGSLFRKINCFYTVFAERNDVEKLQIEIKK